MCKALDDDFNTPDTYLTLLKALYINQLKDKTAILSLTDLEHFNKGISTFVFDVLGLGMRSGVYDSYPLKTRRDNQITN